jgi:hypothetical protein
MSNRVGTVAHWCKMALPVFSYVSGGLDEAEENGEIARLSLENADLRELVKQLGVRVEAMKRLVPERKTGRKRTTVCGVGAPARAKKERGEEATVAARVEAEARSDLEAKLRQTISQEFEETISKRLEEKISKRLEEIEATVDRKITDDKENRSGVQLNGDRPIRSDDRGSAYENVRSGCEEYDFDACCGRSVPQRSMPSMMYQSPTGSCSTDRPLPMAETILHVSGDGGRNPSMY